MAIDAVGAFDRLECRGILGEQLAAPGDTLVGDKRVDIVPERLGEFGLRVDEIHDLHVRLEAGGEFVERATRNAALGGVRPHPGNAIREVRDRRHDRVRRHVGMTRRARLTGPAAARACARDRAGGQRQRLLIAVILRTGGSRQDHERNQRPRDSVHDPHHKSSQPAHCLFPASIGHQIEFPGY